MLKNSFIKLLYILFIASFIYLGFQWKDVYRLNYIREYNLTYNDNSNGVVIYKVLDDNKIKCNFNTIIRIINNLKKDSFHIISEQSDYSRYDVCLSDNIDTFRIVYNKIAYTGTIFTTDFQRFTSSVSYIIEE